MKHLPRPLLLSALLLLALALYRLYRATDPLPEYAPFPAGTCHWRLEMDADAQRWVEVKGRVGQ